MLKFPTVGTLSWKQNKKELDKQKKGGGGGNQVEEFLFCEPSRINVKNPDVPREGTKSCAQPTLIFEFF